MAPPQVGTQTFISFGALFLSSATVDDHKAPAVPKPVADESSIKWYVRAGFLPGLQYISLESVTKPGYFLRHRYGYVRLDQSEPNDLYHHDATFILHELGGQNFAFEASNAAHSKEYLRLQGDHTVLLQPGLSPPQTTFTLEPVVTLPAKIIHGWGVSENFIHISTVPGVIPGDPNHPIAPDLSTSKVIRLRDFTAEAAAKRFYERIGEPSVNCNAFFINNSDGAGLFGTTFAFNAKDGFAYIPDNVANPGQPLPLGSNEPTHTLYVWEVKNIPPQYAGKGPLGQLPPVH